MNKENITETEELEVQTEKKSDDGTASEYIKIGEELYQAAIFMDRDTMYINQQGWISLRPLRFLCHLHP